MERDRQIKALRKKILTEREVREMTRALRNAMGELFVSATKQYGLSVADGIRFMAVSTHLVEAREAKGLTLKMLAKELGVPQYRVAEIERGSTKHVDASLLRRYIDAMGLREWYSRWETANRGLAKRLATPEAGNVTTRFSGRSRATRFVADRGR